MIVSSSKVGMGKTGGTMNGDIQVNVDFSKVNIGIMSNMLG